MSTRSDSPRAASRVSGPTPMTPPYPDYVYDAGNSSLDMPDHRDHLSPMMTMQTTINGFERDLRQQAPYPLYEDDHEADIYGGRGDFFYRLTEEELGSQGTLTPPEIHGSDQNLSVIGPVTSQAPLTYDSDQNMSVIEPNSHLTAAQTPDHDDARPAVSHRPQSETSGSDSSLAIRVPRMRSDMYEPSTGGLHRLSTAPRKVSKRDRFKRFLARLNPFRRRQQAD